MKSPHEPVPAKPSEADSLVGATFQNRAYYELLGIGTEHALVDRIEQLDLAASTPLDDIQDSGQQVRQELIGAIQAGGRRGEVLGIVRVTDLTTNEIRATLNRFARSDTEPAEILGVLDRGTDLEVGRSSEGMGDLSGSVSRKHLAIGAEKNGVLRIADVGSSNGTRVVRANPDSNRLYGNADAWSANSETIREMFDAANNPDNQEDLITSADVPKPRPEDEVVDQHVESYRHPLIEKIAEDAKFARDTMFAVAHSLRTGGRDVVKLSDDEVNNMFASTDFTMRSMMTALETVEFDREFFADEELVDALKLAFDLPILPGNTSLPYDVDWSAGYSIKEHATLLQGMLRAGRVDRSLFMGGDKPGWRVAEVPETLARIETGLAALSSKIAHDPKASRSFDWNYVESCQQIPAYLAHNLVEKMRSHSEA